MDIQCLQALSFSDSAILPETYKYKTREKSLLIRRFVRTFFDSERATSSESDMADGVIL